MKQLTENQIRIGQEEFLLSFHSPSVKLGGTPYVKNQSALDELKRSLLDYVKWFNSMPESVSFLPSSLGKK